MSDTTVAIPEKERDPYDEIPDIQPCLDCKKEFMNLYKIRFQNWQNQILPIRIGRCGHCLSKPKGTS
jgi:hypothetical protein